MPPPAESRATEASTDAARDARGVAVNVLTLLSQASMPAFHVLLARHLGAEYGVYLWCHWVVEVVSIVTLFGMDTTIQRLASVAHERGDDMATARSVGTALRVVALTGLVMATALWIASPSVGHARGSDVVARTIRMAAIEPIFYHITTIFIVATQARRVMKWDFWVRGVAQPLGTFTLTAVAFWLGARAPGAAAAVSITMAVTAVLAACGYGRELSLRTTLAASVTAPMDRATLRAALPLALSSVAWAFAGRLEAILLGLWRPAQEVAAYGASLLFVTTIAQLRGVHVPVMATEFARALELNDRARLRASVERHTRWALLTTCPVAVFFGAFGDTALLLYGRQFGIGASALAVLCFAHVTTVLGLVGYVIPHSGHGRLTSYTGVGMVALQLLLLPILVPRYGLTGAAYSSAASIVVVQVAHGVMAWQIARVHPFSPGVVKVLGAALACLAVGIVLLRALPWSRLPNFGAAVTMAALTYVLTVIALGLEPDERATLIGIARKIKRAP